MPDPTYWPEIMDALADQIRSTLGTADPELELQVLGRRTFNPTPLCVDMYPADLSLEEQAFSGESWDLLVTVRARVSGDQEAMQTWLLLLADPRSPLSVLKSLAANETLSGKVTQVTVGAASGQRLYEDVPGQGGQLGCEWPVRVAL